MSVQEQSVSLNLSETPLSDVKTERGTIEFREDDWENDPQNARNWTWVQKWTAVSIVRFRFLASYVVEEPTSGILFSFRYPCIRFSARCPAP